MTTITDKDIYEHLEHFGVKGMRWGVRNASLARTGTKTSKTSTEKKQTLKKIAISAAAVGAGAIIAGVLIKKHQNMRAAEIENFQKRLVEVREHIAKRGPLRYNTLRPRNLPADKAKLRSKQTWKSEAETLQKIKEHRLITNMKANKDIKSWYDKSNTPLHLREYLPVDITI